MHKILYKIGPCSFKCGGYIISIYVHINYWYIKKCEMVKFKGTSGRQTFIISGFVDCDALLER